MVSDLEKTSDSSLADNEIASLMKTLASNQYKENMGFPKKVLQPFKPLSLPEIASKNEESSGNSDIPNDSEKVTEPKELSENHEENITENNLENPSVSVDNEILENEERNQSKISGSPEIRNLETEVENNNLDDQNSNTEDKQFDKSEASAIGVPIKDKLYTEAEKEDAYQKGLLEAKTKFESERTEEQDKAIKTLYDLIKKLEAQVKIDTNLLEKHLKEEILKISSERVGTAIKEMPTEFIKKIETLVNTIKDKGEERVLKLNPEDYKEIVPLFKDSIDLANFVIIPDQNLEHSDVIIELGGVSLEDKLSDRYSSNEKEGTRSFKIENLEKSETIGKSDSGDQEIISDLHPETGDLSNDIVDKEKITSSSKGITEENVKNIKSTE